MKLSDLTKLIIGGVFSVGLVVLTAVKIVPANVFCPIAAAAIMYIVKEWEKQKEIARITRQLGGK